MKVNKKMRRQALFMALSSKIKDQQYLILDELKLENFKTKAAADTLKNFTVKMDGYRISKKKNDKFLMVLPGKDINIYRALHNLPHANVLEANNLSVKHILENKYLILLKAAIPVIEKTYKF